MYTTNLQSIEVKKAEGKIDAIVEISDGTTTFKKVFTIALREEDVENKIKLQVKHFIEGLQNADTVVAPVTMGAIDLTKVPSTLPTPAETQRYNWTVDYNRLVGAQKLIDLGVISNTLPEYLALKNKVITNFKKEYVNII